MCTFILIRGQVNSQMIENKNLNQNIETTRGELDMCIFFGSRSTIKCLGRSRRLGLDPLPTGDPCRENIDSMEVGGLCFA